MPTLPFRVPWLYHVFPGKERSMRVAEFMGEDGPAVYSIFGGVLFNLGIPLLIGPFRMVLFRSSYVYGFRM